MALALLVYTILVILWGAWVRISHSGDGCGDTWPLCRGQLIPEAQRGKTWIEYGHRLMSGIFGLVVIYFWWVSRKLYPSKSFVRKSTFATMIFTLSEALLGAKLVLFGLVTDNDTPYRAFVMGLHQLNSFMLTGAVALSFFAAGDERLLKPIGNDFKKISYSPFLIILIGITGAWASLSNSLFPSSSLVQGFFADFSKESHFLVQLRGLHPFLALVVGGSFALYLWVQSQATKSLILQKIFRRTFAVLSLAIVFGILTLIFHAPVWMKIFHLTLAHTVWVTILWMIYEMRTKEIS